MKVKSFSISSKRYPNEDRMAIQNMGIYGIAIVLADGMGGNMRIIAASARIQ